MALQSSKKNIDISNKILEDGSIEKYTNTQLRKFIEVAMSGNDLFLTICRCRNGSLCYSKSCMKKYICKFVLSMKENYLQEVYDMFYLQNTKSPYTYNKSILNMISNFTTKHSMIHRFYSEIMEDKLKHVCACEYYNSKYFNCKFKEACIPMFMPLLETGRVDFHKMYTYTLCEKNITKSFEEYKQNILNVLENHTGNDLALIISEYTI